MHRTQIYLSEREHISVALLARERGCSNSEVIRAAIDAYLDEQARDAEQAAAFAEAAGMWANRTDLPDWDEVRRSWDRDVWNADGSH